MNLYEPTNTLKPVAENVWIVDGPVIKFRLAFFLFPFTTRMTIVRLSSGELFVHSPTPLTPTLAAAVEGLGTVRYIVSPTRIHYWWIPEWKRAFPSADVYLAPRVREQAKERIDFETHELAASEGYPWDAEIRTLPVAGRILTEVVFFHILSRTLIFADFMENFEPRMVSSWFVRVLTRLGGVQDPNGGMPQDMRASFPSGAVQEAVRTMLSWKPERIILSHGRWYEKGAEEELRRAFPHA